MAETDRTSKYRPWLRASLIVLWLAILSYALPKEPIDPWGLVSARKITQLVLLMVTIQTVGSALSRKFGSKAGSFLSGFMGGIFSSTAVTAQVAKASPHLSENENRVAALSLLGAILSQLLLSFTIVMTSLDQFYLQATILFLPPILTTALLTFFRSNKVRIETQPPEPKDPLSELLDIAKLSLIIVGFIAGAKLLQIQFGDRGLYILTFLVSLFEVHGSIIANLQLHESGTLNFDTLTGLVTIGLVGSVVSKFAIVLFVGNGFLRTRMITWAAFLGASMLAGYYLSLGFS